MAETTEKDPQRVWQAVAYRILELCRDRDLTLPGLAKEAGVPVSTIKNILSGASVNPGIVTISKLCQGLGVDLAAFFDTPVFGGGPRYQATDLDHRQQQGIVDEFFDNTNEI